MQIPGIEMCGIIGIVSNTEVGPLLLSALRKLEYRGYDSAGMATCNNSQIEVRKGVGNLDEVEKTCRLSHLTGRIGIGHVRWATHGKIDAVNAHPHVDCHHRIAVVHNGIINNFTELRAELKSSHQFLSETDTEVIVHLIEDEMKSGHPLEKAVFNTTKHLRGSYAILAVSSAEPERIVAARQESPLVIGLGKNGNYIASDTICFDNQIASGIYVEDGETVVLTLNRVRILDSEFREIVRQPVWLDCAKESVTKQGHDFFMLKEILEQPQSMRRAVQQDKLEISEVARYIQKARHIFFTACGSSRHAALVGRHIFSRQTGIFSEVVTGSELQYFSNSLDNHSLVIAVSQSGETADIFPGLRKAREKRAKTISLVNTPGSTLTRLSDHSLYLRCGPEIAVAATKSFISQLVIFYLLSFRILNQWEEGLQKIHLLSYLVEENLQHNKARIVRLAGILKDKSDFYFLGRGINFAIASEGALKLKEVARVYAEGIPAGELKHGTLALIEPGTPVLAICPDDYTFEDIISNTLEAKARGAFIIGVSDKPHPVFDEWIDIPQVEEIFYPLMSVIPLQLLAYHSAVVRDYDPDRPRNLAKSVTVK